MQDVHDQPTSSPPGETGAALAHVGPVDFIVAIADRIWLLVLGPLVAGALAYGVALALPKQFTSVAYLKMIEADARAAEVLMRSPAVLDVVLARQPQSDAGLDERRRELSKLISLGPITGDARGKAQAWSLLQVEAATPELARNNALLFLDTWIDWTKPRGMTLERLQQALERAEAQEKSLSVIIKRFESEADKVVAPGTLHGEIATPLSNLILQRDRQSETADKLKQQIEGVPRDIIVVPPTLPSEPTWPRSRLAAALTAIAAIPLLLAFIVIQFAIRSRIWQR